MVQPNNILALPMPSYNDAEAKTIGEYLKKLLAEVWEREECFSGKRPFGNSGWKYEVYAALVIGKVVEGNEENTPKNFVEADKIIADAISAINLS
jgi:hypothetical protein